MVGAALIGGAGAAGLLHLALWALALEEPRPLSAVMLEFYAPALLLTAISALATLRVRLRRQLDERSRPARSEPGHSIPAALALRLGGETILIPYAEINYLSSRRNTTVLHASGRDHALKQSLKAILARLPQDKFIRIHKQYAIAIDRLAALQGGQSGNYVQLRDDDDTRLPVGRAYASRLRQLVAELRPAPIQGQRKVSG